MIEWRQNAPKWEQIANVLKQRIDAGFYPPDSVLPSQQQLAEMCGVTRGTARKVLVRLHEEGIAYSVRGLGTFVSPPRD